MKNNYQLIVWKGEFLCSTKTIEETQSALINWHKGCKGANCLAEVHRGHEILENCGSCVP